MDRWGVKSATLKFGEATYEMAAGPSGKSETREALEVTSLNDTVKRFIQGALKEIDEFTVTLYQKKENNLTADSAPAALELEATLENGIEKDETIKATIAKAIVTKVAYPNHEASGDRKATYDVTFRPDGDEKPVASEASGASEASEASGE